MSRIFLKTNRDKIEKSKKSETEKICSYLLSLSLKHNEQVRHLGIILDCGLSFDNHINKRNRIAFCCLKIYRLENSYLKLTLKLGHAFRSSRLDYCNTLILWVGHEMNYYSVCVLLPLNVVEVHSFFKNRLW